MNYDKIGKFIQEKRKSKDLTQKELAKQLNITDKAVSKWERGLGCPDVSLLERLSEILEVSILSILNGEEISQENMNIEEINDAVLRTISYSKDTQKNQIKMIISNILLGIIFGICGFLIIVNINHLIYVNHTSQYNSEFEINKSMLPQIKINIDKIRNTKSKLSDIDKEEVLSKLVEVYNKIKDNYLVKKDSFISISSKKIYDEQVNETSLSILLIANIIEKYDPSFKEENNFYRDIVIQNLLSSSQIITKIKDTYKYQSYFGIDEYYFNDLPMNALILSVKINIQMLNNLTKYLIEMSDAIE